VRSMAASSNEKLGVFLEVSALGPALFAAANPSFFTTRTFAHTPEGIKDIRIGEGIGTVLTLTLGIGATLAISEPDNWTFTPLLASIGVCVVMVGMYEYGLRHPRQKQTTMVTGGSTDNERPTTGNRATDSLDYAA
jgi:hypothetical protein